MKKIIVVVLVAMFASSFIFAKEKEVKQAPSQLVAVGAVRGENIDFAGNSVENIQDLVVQSCYDAGLRCLERTDLSAVMAEQDLAASPRAAKGQNKAKTGELKVADVLVSCALTGKTYRGTEIGVTDNIIFRTLGVHGIGVSGDRVTMTCRAYDSSTSEILLSKTTPKFAMQVEAGILSVKGSATKAVQRSLNGFFTDLRGQL